MISSSETPDHRSQATSAHGPDCEAKDQPEVPEGAPRSTFATTHRVRKRSRRDSSSISTSVIKAVNGRRTSENGSVGSVRASKVAESLTAHGESAVHQATANTKRHNSVREPLSPSLQLSDEQPEGQTILKRVGVWPSTRRLSGSRALPSEMSDQAHNGAEPNQAGLSTDPVGESTVVKLSGKGYRVGPDSDNGLHRQPSDRATEQSQIILGESHGPQPQSVPRPKMCTCGASPSQANAQGSDLPDQTSANVSRSEETPVPAPAGPPRPETFLPANPPSAPPQANQFLPNPTVNTTLYRFPPRYTTFQQPLTPEEMRFLQRNPTLFSRTVTGLSSSGISGDTRSTAHTTGTHTCGCGDACNCLGCIAHPYNARTLSFVQSLQDLMATENLYEDQGSRRRSVQHRPIHGLPATFPAVEVPYTALSPRSVGGQNGGSWTQNRSSLVQAVNGEPSPRPPVNLGWVGTNHGAESAFQPAEVSRQVFTGNGDVQDQYALSPSAYFHVDYPMGCCNAGSDGCLCGDICSCAGPSNTHPNGGLPASRNLDDVVPTSGLGFEDMQWNANHLFLPQVDVTRLPVQQHDLDRSALQHSGV